MVILLGFDKWVLVLYGYLIIVFYIFNSISCYFFVFLFLIELYVIYWKVLFKFEVLKMFLELICKGI